MSPRADSSILKTADCMKQAPVTAAIMPSLVVDSEVGVGCCSSECEVVEHRFEPDGETEFCQDGYNHIVRRSKVKSTAWVHRGFTDDVTEVTTVAPGGDKLSDFQKDKFRHFFT